MLRKIYKRFLKKKVNSWLAKLNYNKKICINGMKISIPSIQGITCEMSEPWMVELLGKLLQYQSGAFLDVGVNLGQTLIKVKALDQHREYIGFEPNPVCVNYVQQLIKENGFVNCTLIPVGLFTENCLRSLDLTSDDSSDSAASLIDNFRPDVKIYSKVLVPVFTLDSLSNITKNVYVGIIKVDVEGAELEVIKSVLKLILYHKPIVLIEILPVYSDANTFRLNRQVELENIFADADYTIFRVEKTISGAFSGLRRMDKISIHSDLNQCDYVVAPKEQIAKLKQCDASMRL
jgi:FkbM family methyltransferase